PSVGAWLDAPISANGATRKHFGEPIMEKKSRRGLLKNSAKVAAGAAGAALLTKEAQAQPKMEKRSAYPDTKPSMYSRAVAFGNLLFLSGVGYHQPGNIED